MRAFALCFVTALSTSLTNAGKFDGVSLGASVGGTLAHLKERGKDGLYQLGANGKIYLGIGKSLLDTIFVGAEAWGRYSFFTEKKDNDEAANGSAQFGGHIKAGIRPRENFLIYAVYGIQTNSAKIKGAFEKFFEPSNGAWTNYVGGGVEYAFGLSIAGRAEVVCEPEISFKLKEIPDISYDASFFSINLGIVGYL